MRTYGLSFFFPTSKTRVPAQIIGQRRLLEMSRCSANNYYKNRALTKFWHEDLCLCRLLRESKIKNPGSPLALPCLAFGATFLPQTNSEMEFRTVLDMLLSFGSVLLTSVHLLRKKSLFSASVLRTKIMAVSNFYNLFFSLSLEILHNYCRRRLIIHKTVLKPAAIIGNIWRISCRGRAEVHRNDQRK